MIYTRHSIIDGINWPGAFFGLFIGVLSYLALSMFGVALAGGFFSFGTVDELGWIGLFWMAATLAISAFLAGFLGSRAAPGLATRRGGGYIGLLAGTLLLLTFTFFTINSIVSVGRGAFGAVQNAAGGLSELKTPGLGALGVENDLRSMFDGISRQEIEQTVANELPELDRQQVSAAGAVAENVIREAVSEISGSLTNPSELGAVIRQQAQNINDRLSGREFVGRLEGQGLTQAEAEQVTATLNRQLQEYRTRLNAAVDRTTAKLEQAAQTAAEYISRAAWLWLLAAAILVGFAAIGGVQGSAAERLREEYEETEERAPIHH